MRPDKELPLPAVRSRLVSALGRRVTGVASSYLATGREVGIKAQFRLVRPEFAGAPLLCWLCAREIIAIRRELDPVSRMATLRYLFETPAFREVLLEHLNTRWLIAVCDTFADYGEGGERPAAVCLSTLINLTKLAETERLVQRDPTWDPAAVAGFREVFPHTLWDGVTSYLLDTGDMPRNLFARLGSALGDYPPLDSIGSCLMERLRNNPSHMLARFSELNPRFWE